MILLALAAAAMCPPFDTVCLDAKVARLEREVARQRQRADFIMRMARLCNPQTPSYAFAMSDEERKLWLAKSRACRARYKKEYEAMGMTP